MPRACLELEESADLEELVKEEIEALDQLIEDLADREARSENEAVKLGNTKLRLKGLERRVELSETGKSSSTELAATRGPTVAERHGITTRRAQQVVRESRERSELVELMLPVPRLSPPSSRSSRSETQLRM
jgi:hypothetical protein